MRCVGSGRGGKVNIEKDNEGVWGVAGGGKVETGELKKKK